MDDEIEAEIDQLKNKELVFSIDREEDGVQINLFIYHADLPRLLDILNNPK